jgi:hypothetical protein
MSDSPNARSLSRRIALAALSATAVALPALPIMAAASETDPIFAAIAAHREATAAEIAAVHANSRLDATLPREKTTWHWSVYDTEPPADCNDAPEWIAAEVALGDAGDAEDDALLAVLTTTPTTLAGIVALLEYVGGPTFPGRPITAFEPLILVGAHDTVWEEIHEAARTFLPRVAAMLRSA